MDDQLQKQLGWRKRLSDVLVSETTRKTLPKTKDLKQLLEHDQTGERRQALVFEAELRNLGGFSCDVFSATLHQCDLLVVGYGVLISYTIQTGRLFVDAIFRKK